MESAACPGARTPAAHAATRWSCPAMTTGVPASSPVPVCPVAGPATPPSGITGGIWSVRSPARSSSPGTYAAVERSKTPVRAASVGLVATVPVRAEATRSAVFAQHAMRRIRSGSCRRSRIQRARGSFAPGRRPVDAKNVSAPTAPASNPASRSARRSRQLIRSPAGAPRASSGTPVSAMLATPTAAGGVPALATQPASSRSAVVRTAPASPGVTARSSATAVPSAR